MKTLKVYTPYGFETYPRLFEDYTFRVEKSGVLSVYKSLSKDSESSLLMVEEIEALAVFREWTYYIIEGEFDE